MKRVSAYACESCYMLTGDRDHDLPFRVKILGWDGRRGVTVECCSRECALNAVTAHLDKLSQHIYEHREEEPFDRGRAR